MNKETILVIDDEQQIRKLLDIVLTGEGYHIIMASSAKEGMLLAANHQPELILLDLNLPDQHGLETLVELRQWFNRAIIILSVIDQEASIVQALDSGASDYLTKPFRTGELLARIRSAIKRNTHAELSSEISVNELCIDMAAHTLKKNGAIVKLTSTEFSLLALFAQNRGRVLTHQYILKEIWGVGQQSETQYLRVFVAQLRKKIEDNPNKPTYIITESGVGYRFSD
jgi:two-component system KDP operon response regulator KdpE